MRRICLVGLLAALLLASCSDRRRGAREVDPDEAGRPRHDHRRVAGDPGRPDRPVRRVSASADEVVASLPEATRQERYEAALLEAVDFLAEQKYREALAALEKAQKLQDTGAVQREVDKVRAILAQQAAAEKAVADVKAVLQDGRPDEAARLAGQALGQYGGVTAAGEPLARLKQQADAFVSAAADNAAARQAALRAEAEAALKENNLRSAAVALEQVLALGEDVALRRQLDGVRARLARHDDLRGRAAALRRDPATLEEAIGLLRAAAREWDTLPVRQEIDECTLVLQRRRDRVAVADFEVRGDVGVAAAGRAVAEGLMPHLRPRFDVVERAQLGRVLDEIRLTSAELGESEAGRRELARLSRVRYLVVGSVTPLAGVTLQARLVEARSGLVVQTARVSAPSLEALLPRLEQAARVLQMSDEQKLAYEEKLRGAVEVVRPVEVSVSAALPPPPPPPAPAAPPPAPIVTWTPAPPALGNLVIEDFRRLPAVVVAPPPPPAAALVIQREPAVHGRLLRLSLEVGDNLLRRRRYAEAQRHFSVALTLAGPRREIQLRIDRCRDNAPPPPAVVQVVPAAPAAPVVVAPPARPRLAVFGFYVSCQPGLVPAALGDHIADQLAPYCGGYEMIDRGEVCWYMGRLGITMKEVLTQPPARLALAQALNARTFVFGTIQQTNSFNVDTHLMDAQTGARTGTASIHVKDQEELKLRLGELARQMGARPAEQAQLARQGPRTEKALNEARALLQAGKPDSAEQLLGAALKEDPSSPALLALQQQAAAQARQARLEAERRKAEADRALAVAAALKRQEDLARQAAEARRQAEQAAKARGEAARRAQEDQKARAAEQLRTRARQLAARGDHAGAVSALQSATALKADDGAFKELAQARAAAELAQKQKLDAERHKREDEDRKRREAAAQKVAAERAAREKAEADRRNAQAARDQAAHDAHVRQARELLAKKQYAQAAAAAESARRVKDSDEATKLARQARDGAALAEAERQGAAARAAAARKLEEERRQRESAQAQQRKNQEAYNAALAAGQKATAERRYAEAAARYEAALKLFRTDAALAGLKQAQELQAREKAQAEQLRQQQAAEAQKAARIKELLAQGQGALARRQFDQAIAAYRAVTALQPGHVEALAGLSKAERERDAEADRARREREQKARQAQFDRLVADGRAHLNARRWPQAQASLRQAVGLSPADAAAKALLAQADAGAAAARTPPAPQPGAKPAAPAPKPAPPARPAVDPRVAQREADYQKAMGAAQSLLKANNFQGAAGALDLALQAKPGDPTATALKADAQRRASDAALASWLAQGQSALRGKKYAEALQAFTEALKVRPNDPTALRGKAEAEQGLKPPPAPPKPAPAQPAPATKAAPPKPAPVPQPTAPTAQQEYARWMAAGAALEKQQKWAEAASAYTAALGKAPGDAKAAAALRGAAYQQHMAAGRSAHAQKKFADAAKSYAEALKLAPASAEARQALERAKVGKP